MGVTGIEGREGQSRKRKGNKRKNRHRGETDEEGGGRDGKTEDGEITSPAI